MKMTASITLNLKTKEVQEVVMQAAKLTMRDIVVDVAADAIEGSPVKTGNNRRSIQYEVGPNAEVAKGELEAAVYSTSGYGGFL
jgi:hypothetical protein